MSGRGFEYRLPNSWRNDVITHTCFEAIGETCGLGLSVGICCFSITSTDALNMVDPAGQPVIVRSCQLALLLSHNCSLFSFYLFFIFGPALTFILEFTMHERTLLCYLVLAIVT